MPLILKRKLPPIDATAKANEAKGTPDKFLAAPTRDGAGNVASPAGITAPKKLVIKARKPLVSDPEKPIKAWPKVEIPVYVPHKALNPSIVARVCTYCEHTYMLPCDGKFAQCGNKVWLDAQPKAKGKSKK